MRRRNCITLLYMRFCSFRKLINRICFIELQFDSRFHLRYYAFSRWDVIIMLMKHEKNLLSISDF